MNTMKHELLTLEIEPDLKSEMERVCRKLGMNISTAFAILARKFIREQETSSGALSEDLFYSPSNIEYLKKVTTEIDAGTAKLFAHSVDWDSIPEAEPDEIDLQMLAEIESDKDCHEFISSDEAEKMLGLA